MYNVTSILPILQNLPFCTPDIFQSVLSICSLFLLFFHLKKKVSFQHSCFLRNFRNIWSERGEWKYLVVIDSFLLEIIDWLIKWTIGVSQISTNSSCQHFRLSLMIFKFNSKKIFIHTDHTRIISQLFACACIFSDLMNLDIPRMDLKQARYGYCPYYHLLMLIIP